MQGKVFIHATNIHQGGGRSLLEALLNAIDDKTEFVLTLDERMPMQGNLAHNVKITRVKPSVVKRLAAERWLAHNVAPEDIVLCFGNLPPLFRLRGQTVVFVQNRYLIDDVRLSGFPLGVRLRLAIERLWLSAMMPNANEFVIQTPSMKRLLELKTRGKVPVRVLPFVADPNGCDRGAPKLNVQKRVNYDFVYVASGERHKNHRRLIEAWCLLAKENLFPSLCLTLDEVRFAGLCREIEAMRNRYAVRIINVGELSHENVFALYKESGAMIYPSTVESFGLPLIEASRAGMPVLASELDYVRDVVNPEQAFDPDSAISIARAVKRFMGSVEQPLPLLNASQFLASVFGGKLQ